MQIPHHATIPHPGPQAAGAPMREAAKASSSSSPGPSSNVSTSSATVTANDFLELLVTEMKNQDPTANTDPNEYINQLVQVNSLEQLIQINQDLGSGSGSGASGSASDSRMSAVRGNLSPNLSGYSKPGPSNLAAAAKGVARALTHEANAPTQSTPSPSESQLPSRLFTEIRSAARL